MISNAEMTSNDRSFEQFVHTWKFGVLITVQSRLSIFKPWVKLWKVTQDIYTKPSVVGYYRSWRCHSYNYISSFRLLAQQELESLRLHSIYAMISNIARRQQCNYGRDQRILRPEHAGALIFKPPPPYRSPSSNVRRLMTSPVQIIRLILKASLLGKNNTDIACKWRMW